MANTSSGSRKTKSGSAKKSTAAGKRGAGGAGTRNGGKNMQQARHPVRREIGAVVCGFLGMFAFLGYFSIDAIFIKVLKNFVGGLIGWGFYVLPPALVLAAVVLGFHGGKPVVKRTLCILLVPIIFGATAHLLFCKTPYSFSGNFISLVKSLYTEGSAMACGGLFAGMLSMGMEALFSVYGAFPILLALLLFALMVSVNLSFAKIGAWVNGRERLEYEQPEPEPEPEVLKIRGRHPIETGKEAQLQRPRTAPIIDIPLDGDTAPEPREEKTGFFNRSPRVKRPDEVISEEEISVPPVVPADMPPAVSTPITPVRPSEIVSRSADQNPVVTKISRDEIEAEKAAVMSEIDKAAAKDTEEYMFPPLDLLKRSRPVTSDCRDEIAENHERLESTLHSFGVAANIVGETRGPTVTRYDLELDAGVKLAKLTGLSGDIALSLGVANVRIAPIPDRISTVGIEVPNKVVSVVCLRDILESQAFRTAKSSLTFAIGKDISGTCICGDVSKLPHMLIAGTTGSGKSVCINSLLLSLMYKATPEELRLIMIDPKMVELGIYNGIPHLFVPVVTDAKKAAGALQWAVVEMLKRYRIFSETGVRSLKGYNEHQKSVGGEIIPQVVIVVDELADLMLCAAKDVEESICRVAQMGRAAGMHLIIATQRPSADVITGLMKANIPSRIAFAVSSALESRIILDATGAEKLIGTGDMLYFPVGSGKPTRIQGAFVSDAEREQVVDFLKNSAQVQYSDEVIAEIEKAAAEKDSAEEEKGANGNGAPDAAFPDCDELLPQAVDVLFETKQASVSMLQRRLKLGYSRAARIVDQMESLGIVGPFEGSKPRALLINRQQWLEMQQIHGTAPTERFATESEFGVDGEDL